ncbi:hypothetical protein GCM10011391_11060 [Pullulanibacillus camelliae]|uniref:N-acetyltransferase domain-containing protein n=1 Tax=Pullulanibacillus camelliae TaxID=1707096 RepID=A0A8J2YGC4_9BACL|nr:GNAT family N-acetyltransferase [Pullulanibacillus camelliae]GGE34132.1 hypothetical protein GCM10011391_11060 [Pullulanibacillus camelliae]
MEDFKETPWDRQVYGLPTYELIRPTEENLKRTEQLTGHFTVRVHPLVSKKLLHRYGFYYCDTLIEPICRSDAFQPIFDSRVSVMHAQTTDHLVQFCLDTFKYDRFHRDFNLDPEKGDIRYANWLQSLAAEGRVLTLKFEDISVGFFAYRENQILLHAIGQAFQGQGLGKYLWSAACQMLFSEGYQEIKSSVSAANLAIVNVYRQLGFSFKHPVDIYHKYRPAQL